MKKTETPTGWGWQLAGDRVAILAQPEKKTSGGIIIPQTAEKRLNQGVIAALGDECGLNDEGLPKSNYRYYVGQEIKYGKYAGSEMIGEDGKEYLIMREADIAAYKPKTK